MAKTITHSKDNTVSYWGEEDLLQAAQSSSYVEMIFELLSEQKPTPAQAKLFELVLNLSIDHGPETPSAVRVIEKAQQGGTLSESLAEGILQINDQHGGAVQGGMENLYALHSGEKTAKQLVAEYNEQNKRLPGLGHRLYKTGDPRTAVLFEKLKQQNNKFIDLEESLRQEVLKQNGKDLSINIDGAIAVLLCSFDWEPRLGNAVFLIARVPGLCGQYLNASR